jgi:hypothetical protein
VDGALDLYESDSLIVAHGGEARLVESSSIRGQKWKKGMARGNGERLIAKLWNSRGVRALTWGYQGCHRSALPLRMSCSRSILASTLSRRPPS